MCVSELDPLERKERDFLIFLQLVPNSQLRFISDAEWGLCEDL